MVAPTMPFRLISVGASTARPPSAISCPCHPERSEAATTAKRCADALAKGEGNEALRVEFRKERTSKPQGANALWDLSKNVAIQCAQSNIWQVIVRRVHTAPSRSSLGRDPSARLYWLARDDSNVGVGARDCRQAAYRRARRSRGHSTTHHPRPTSPRRTNLRFCTTP